MPHSQPRHPVSPVEFHFLPLLILLHLTTLIENHPLSPAPSLTLCSQVSTEKSSIYILQKHQTLLRGRTQQVVEPVIREARVCETQQADTVFQFSSQGCAVNSGMRRGGRQPGDSFWVQTLSSYFGRCVSGLTLPLLPHITCLSWLLVSRFITLSSLFCPVFLQRLFCRLE